ncbi:MAG: hypothetical protein LBB25_03820 [Holosporaceae bacterium]|nr:hypothetical protein [Holosporaceae bacterium]
MKAEGPNSLIAKQKALLRASSLAFEKLVNSLLQRGSFAEKSIPNQQIQNCICDYSIKQEKFSDSVYKGKISYRFLKNKTLSLLRSYGAHTDMPNEESKIVKLIVYRKDFIHCTHELNKLKVMVEKFDDGKVIFSINARYIADFRRLHIKYAQLI